METVDWWSNLFLDFCKHKNVLKLLTSLPKTLYITEGSLYKDYVSTFTLDTNYQAIYNQLLNLEYEGKPLVAVREHLVKSKTLWHKIWIIEKV